MRFNAMRWLCLLFTLLGPLDSHAHSVGTSYVYVTTRGQQDLDVRVDLHVRDAEFALGIDGNENGVITWNELLDAQGALNAYVSSRLTVSRAQRACEVTYDQLLVNDLNDGSFAVLTGHATCPIVGAVGVSSDLMFDTDAQHRTLVQYRDAQRSTGTVLSIDQRSWEAPQSMGESSRWRELSRFVGQGVHHIWIGFDHLAFLFILLLPAVIPLVRSGAAVRHPITRVFVIVSAFTLAHSITLALAVLELVTLPERAVEAAIAASVIAAALANLHPQTRDLGPITAFAFGLLHGFGFANALAGLDLARVDGGIALLGFNIGVELGQLAIVAAALPVLHLVRHTRFYVMKVVPAGSVAVAGLGTVWLVQRLAI
jgi:hypothetical protein